MTRAIIVGSLAALAVLTAAPQNVGLAGEPDDSLRIGRHVFQVRRQDPTRGSLDILTDGKVVKHITGAAFSLHDFGDEPAGWKNGSDINGDSVPEVLVQEYTGGMHCCTSWRIFRAGREVEQIFEFSNGHTDFCPLIQEDGNSRFAVQLVDWTFAYWKTDFASSPAIRLIYSWQNGAYAFSPTLTRTPPPSEAGLREKARKLDWGKTPPPQFWSDMLDLIGSGNADRLAFYITMAWPANRPGKSEFLTAFVQQLRHSAYWPQLNALNAGKLEAALPK
jgi:hypothetical protein